MSALNIRREVDTPAKVFSLNDADKEGVQERERPDFACFAINLNIKWELLKIRTCAVIQLF